MISTFFKPFVVVLFLSSLSSCAAPPTVDAVRASRTSVESTISSVTSGTVTAEQEAELAFGAVGRVASLNAQVGSLVAKGDILAEIENKDLKSSLLHAEHDFNRAKSLTKSELMPPQEYEHARQTFELSSAALEKSIIRAPFDGQITEVNLEIGQLSQITAVIPRPLLRIVDTKPRFVQTDIDEVDLPKVALGMAARVRVLAVRREPFNAQVRLVIPFVSAAREQDRTSRIELTVDSQELVLPVGASADVEIISVNRPNVVALPSRAILGKGSTRYVYQIDDSTIRKIPVSIGIGNYEKTEILSGVSEGALVAIPSEKTELKESLAVNAQVQSWP